MDISWSSSDAPVVQGFNSNSSLASQRSDIFATDATRWTAICSRDPMADGVFVYLVKTTKIYCRPTCKARRARRANINFCRDASEAEAAGYRPCKRCQPQMSASMPEDAAVIKIRQFVASCPPDLQLSSLRDMARQTGLSKWHFHRVFKRTIGLTPAEFARLSSGTSSAPRSPEIEQ